MKLETRFNKDDAPSIFLIAENADELKAIKLIKNNCILVVELVESDNPNNDGEYGFINFDIEAIYDEADSTTDNPREAAGWC